MVNIASILEIELKRNIEIKNKVFDNNNETIVLVTKPGNLSRTKYIHTKHWFFKEYIGVDKSIILRKIETENQIINIYQESQKYCMYH